MAATPRARPTWASRIVTWRAGGRGAPAGTAEVRALPGDLERAREDLHALAASAVHELRTPLSALSGEVELALARDRTPDAYREALTRIADQVARLVELTGDLAILAAPQPSPPAPPDETANLGAVLEALVARGGPSQETQVIGETAARETWVLGDEGRLTRALILLVEHARRHRSSAGRVRLRLARLDGDDPVELILEVARPRFPGLTWHHLAGRDGAPPTQAAGLLRLRTADRIVEDCGGSLRVRCSPESDTLVIRLRRVGPSDAGAC